MYTLSPSKKVHSNTWKNTLMHMFYIDVSVCEGGVGGRGMGGGVATASLLLFPRQALLTITDQLLPSPTRNPSTVPASLESG